MRRLLGLAFVILLIGLTSLSVLVYRKAFTTVDWVTLQTSHAGMQLSPGADVKLRGVLVGEVRDITADGSMAVLRLALDPEQHIPADVTARLLPKTLFGERYVALVAGTSGRLQNGDVIGQDRSSSAVELERILDEALPLLQAIQPDKLAAVLGALAYALDGRGNALGATLSSANGYLSTLNSQLPALAVDIKRLAKVLDTYHGALPDLLTILRNATITMTTISDQRTELATFLAHTTDLASSTRTFLDRYDDRIIQLGQVSRPVLELLAAYAPEYPCLFQGLVALQPRAEKVFSSGRMHITLEAVRDNGKFEKGRDEPVYGAHNGPSCRGLPSPGYAHGVVINDGYDYSGERDVIKVLVGAANGVTPDQVPDVAVLLWGPLLRGSEVNAQ